MAKRKTRKQKILADKRHILYHLETNTAQVERPIEKTSEKIKVDLPSVLPTYQTQPPRVASLTSYSYVFTDIRKTALITGAIIAAQVILFFALNRL